MLNFYSLFFLFSTDFHLLFASTNSIILPILLCYFVLMYSMTMINVDFILLILFWLFVFAFRTSFAICKLQFISFCFHKSLAIHLFKSISCQSIDFHFRIVILFKRKIGGNVWREFVQFIVKNSIFREILLNNLCQNRTYSFNYDKQEYRESVCVIHYTCSSNNHQESVNE